MIRIWKFNKMLARLTVLTMCVSLSLCDVDVCNDDNSVNITNGVKFPNGIIFADGVRYAKNEYYYDIFNDTMRGCSCKEKVCIKKCCPFGQGYSTDFKCVDIKETFDPDVWNKYKKLENVRALDLFRFVPGKVNCSLPEYRIQIGDVTNGYHIIEDGSLFVELNNKIPPWTIRSVDTYCVDTFMVEGRGGEIITKMDALVCFANEDGEHHYVLSSTCMLISCVFILMTCAVYAWLPELRNLHGRVLMAYLLTLFVGFLFLATMQILLHEKSHISTNMCLVMTFIIYWSLISAFLWLNVMSFDIWWTFSGKRGISLEKLSTRGRFYAYAMYAFSIPTALTVLLAALEFADLEPAPGLPMLKRQGCFISGTSKMIYLYGPIVITCIANCVFFILTAVKITQIKQQTSVLKSKESSTHDQHRKDKQRLLLYFKLFAVMGLNWILEVISAIYPDEGGFIWRITDAYNVLIGLIIFIIFVCKRKILQLIKKRYWQLRGDSMSRTHNTSSRTLSRDDTQISSIKLNIKK